VHFPFHNAFFNAKTCIRIRFRVGLDFDDSREVFFMDSITLTALGAAVSPILGWVIARIHSGLRV
jgi:hypothetical protein